MYSLSLGLLENLFQDLQLRSLFCSAYLQLHGNVWHPLSSVWCSWFAKDRGEASTRTLTSQVQASKFNNIDHETKPKHGPIAPPLCGRLTRRLMVHTSRGIAAEEEGV